MAENDEFTVGPPNAVNVDVWGLDGVDQTGHRYNRCLDFTFEKERYTPYTTLRTRFLMGLSMVKPAIPKMVDFYINGIHVHRGMADRVAEVVKGKVKYLDVYSKGFGCCLYTGQVRPDTYTNMSLDKLMTVTGVYQYLDWEQNTNSVPSLTITEMDDVWNAATKLCYRLYRTHPYCISPGTIRFTPNPDAKSHVMSWNDKQIISMENATDVSKVITSMRMRDPTGYYGNSNYIYDNNFYKKVGFWRQKLVAYDKEWSDDPKTGVEFLARSTHRRMRQCYITYKGFNGEEIGDTLTMVGQPLLGMPGFTNASICYIHVSSQEGDAHLTTRLGIYIDPYNNNGI